MSRPVPHISQKVLGLSFVALVVFLAGTQFRTHTVLNGRLQLPQNMVVISAPIQILMYAGDRFLGANLEAIRVAAIGTEDTPSLTAYRLRAYDLVSQLNPCHEDNYYMANALLIWGGAVDEGNDILERAINCRFWDEFPSFFYGFNQYFFHHDLESAQNAFTIAAERSTKNRASIQAISISLAARQLNDEKMAVAYLRHQRDQTNDKILAASLERRLRRLEGLIVLRDAQKQFEKKYGRPLTNPDDLLSSGILKAVPQDPMRIGYDFIDGVFLLGALKIGRMEIR